MGGINYIELTDLLRQREAEFVAIWKCEEEIRRLLGGVDYPFEAPPALPCRAPVKKKIVTAHKPAETAEQQVRALRGDENAYRVTYLSCGRRESSFQTDAALLATLTNIRSDECRLLKIETVVFRGLGDWTVRECVWQGESATGDERN